MSTVTSDGMLLLAAMMDVLGRLSVLLVLKSVLIWLTVSL